MAAHLLARDRFLHVLGSKLGVPELGAVEFMVVMEFMVVWTGQEGLLRGGGEKHPPGPHTAVPQGRSDLKPHQDFLTGLSCSPWLSPQHGALPGLSVARQMPRVPALNTRRVGTGSRGPSRYPFKAPQPLFLV